MNAKKVFLAVDLGASGGRVIAGIYTGKEFRLQEIHRFPNRGIRAGDRLLWDWLALWQNIKDGLRLAGQQFSGDEIVSVGVDTWGVDFALLGADDSLIGSPICYRDSQTLGILEQAFDVVSREDIFAQTGLQFLEFNSLFQLFAMKQRNRSALDSAHRFLMIPDLFHWLLCGESVNEATDASTSQLLNPVSGNWAHALMDAFEIPQSIFGPIVGPGTSLGALRKSVADEVGLRQIQVVVPASHDTASAVAAVPVESEPLPKPTWCYISSGTWSCVGVELASPEITDLVRRLDFTNEGGVDGTTRLLKNVAGLWLVQECRRVWAQENNDLNWEQLVELAATEPARRSLVPPDHQDLLSPRHMPEAISNICHDTGQPIPENEGQFIRCALESIALRYRMVIERLEQITQTEIDTIHIVGGGTQNRLLNQFAADATGRRVLTGPVEATATGNLLMQMIGAGELADLQQARDLVSKHTDVQQYDPDDADEWDQAFESFCHIAES